MVQTALLNSQRSALQARKAARAKVRKQHLDERAAKINAAIERKCKADVQFVLEVGRELRQAEDMFAKYKSPEACFSKWCRKNINVGRTTIWKWRQVAEFFSDLTRSQSEHFRLSALYLLSEASVRKKVRDNAKELASKGKTITRGYAAQLIKAHEPVIPSNPPQGSFGTIGDTDVMGTLVNAACMKVKSELEKCDRAELLCFLDNFDAIWEATSIAIQDHLTSGQRAKIQKTMGKIKAAQTSLPKWASPKAKRYHIQQATKNTSRKYVNPHLQIPR